MRQECDAARADDPLTGRREIAPLALELGQGLLDADPEHVPVAIPRQEAVELDARQHDEVGLDGASLRCQWSVSATTCIRALVVACERARRELAVGVGRMGVQRRAQPVAGGTPGRVHAESLLQWCRQTRTIAGHGTT